MTKLFHITCHSWVCFAIAQVFIVEASGRRLLLLIGFGICCVACLTLTVALSLQVWPITPISQYNTQNHFQFDCKCLRAHRCNKYHQRSVIDVINRRLELWDGEHTFAAVFCLVGVRRMFINLKSYGAVIVCWTILGDDALDALCQHRLCHHLCHWPRHRPE